MIRKKYRKIKVIHRYSYFSTRNLDHSNGINNLSVEARVYGNEDCRFCHTSCLHREGDEAWSLTEYQTDRGMGFGMLAQMTLFISGLKQEKSRYTVSRSTSVGQAPSCVRFARVFSLVMRARTHPVPFILLARYPARLADTQTEPKRVAHVRVRIHVGGMASRSASPRYWRAVALSPWIRAGRGRP